MPYTIDYLMMNSKLPGPRSNLELLYAFIQNAEEADVSKCLAVNYDKTNSPEEFVLSCGVGGSIHLAAVGQVPLKIDLKHYANHESWRVREAICMGFQKSKDLLKPTEMLNYLEPLKKGTELEIRTYIATLCEPLLLKNYIESNRVLEDLHEITVAYFDHPNKLNESEKVLRKALGYCWSVALCGQDADRAIFERLLKHKDSKHINWIIAENLKKSRLEKMDVEWVNGLRKKLAAEQKTSC